jgi:plasmid stability protein
LTPENRVGVLSLPVEISVEIWRYAECNPRSRRLRFPHSQQETVRSLRVQDARHGRSVGNSVGREQQSDPADQQAASRGGEDLNLDFPAPNLYFDKEEACRYQCFNMITKMLSKKQKLLVGSFLSVWLLSTDRRCVEVSLQDRRNVALERTGKGRRWVDVDVLARS